MTTLLGLDLDGRLVVVVGGGPVAARRVDSYLADRADVLLVAPYVCEDLAARIDEGVIRWRATDVERADLDGAWLVHTCTGDRAMDTTVARWAQEQRTFCVNATDGARSSARTPATAQYRDLQIGVVSTGAPDPGRSARIRDQLAAALDGGSLDMRPRRASGGRVVLVGGGPGDPDLVTVRGRLALAAADVVVADRLGPTTLLEKLPAGVEVIDVGKTPGHHPVPQAEINRLLVEHAQRGRTVVRLKGGDPFVLGRGGEEVLACQESGVPVEVVPGVSSALAVPAVAGIPLTHRGTATAFHVLTGHDSISPSAISGLLDGSTTLVILMGVACLPDIATSALRSGVDPATPVAIIENGTMPQQRVTRSRLDAVVADAQRVGVAAPAVIVIGQVAGLDLAAVAGSRGTGALDSSSPDTGCQHTA